MCLSNASSPRWVNLQNRASKIVSSLAGVASCVSIFTGIARTACCKLLGVCDHDVREVVSDRLYYQKDQQPMRHWFDGRYRFCIKPHCYWAKFYGAPISYQTDRADQGERNVRKS